ncbi:MAG TPA: porin PorA family protein [Acidimicrobiales bacterium]|nr:porin PorA family protein [Acidimicrobiales bacterium]
MEPTSGLPRSGHRYPRTALLVAAAFALAALAWLVIGVPTFVKYPTDLEASPRYEGTFRAFVDLSMAPLAEPLEMPLTVDRRIEAIEGESGSSRVVVRETIDQKAGDLVDATQTNEYVMDRSTLQNVDDDRAYAFDPANTADRAGAYRLNLPFDTSRDETYEIYKNEIGDTYVLRPDKANPTSHVEGLELSNFTATRDEAPLTDAYLAELNKVVTLPETVTLDQLKPHLLQAGIDVDSLVAALTPVLTPEDAATLSAFAAEPIPLEYVLSFDGTAAVEPVTGAEVRVANAETVGARPVLTSLPTLQGVLAHYPGIPEATAASAALGGLSSAPATQLFQFDYEQTPASVADIADEARSMRRQVLAAKVWLPLALAAGAALSLAVGAGVAVRRGRTRRSGSTARTPARHRPAFARKGTGPTTGTSSA